ncbi:L-threonine ammonia-lyase-like [Sycon ciliatum]|uniref:L-threonine ammonia-lyase-like n=1 Tax=Sycon ciliatum TaxID=27933 RepID=UPI0031F6216D
MSTLLPPAGAAPIVTLPSTETVHEARKRIAPHVLRTPLVELLGPTDETALGNSHAEEDGNGDASAPLKIYLKLENLQHTGCFKARGAFNALLSCDAETCRNHGVITSSAGNFGQGLAWCARNLGYSCTVVVPNSAPETKVTALKRYGADVVPVSYQEWWRTMETRSVKGIQHKHFVHPCADSAVIAGNGTIALEILEDLPDVDAVVVPYGGGGMCAGVGAVMKEMRPQCKVFPVEVETSAPLRAACAAGKPTQCQHTPTFVDGIGGKSVLPEMWPLVTQVMEQPLAVSLEETATAIRSMVRVNHTVAEGAGAAPLAAAVKGLAGRGKIVAVVSGGNIDLDTLAAVLQGEIPTPGGRPTGQE